MVLMRNDRIIPQSLSKTPSYLELWTMLLKWYVSPAAKFNDNATDCVTAFHSECIVTKCSHVFYYIMP